MIEISKGRLFFSKSFKTILMGRKLNIFHSDPGSKFTIDTGLKATRLTSFKQ